MLLHILFQYLKFGFPKFAATSFLLDFELIRKGSKCKGAETFEGYTSNVESCAAICKSSATRFVYGECKTYGRRCSCELDTINGYCKEVIKSAEYDLYSIREGKDL